MFNQLVGRGAPLSPMPSSCVYRESSSHRLLNFVYGAMSMSLIHEVELSVWIVFTHMLCVCRWSMLINVCVHDDDLISHLANAFHASISYMVHNVGDNTQHTISFNK